jgi:hypothetical protein
VEGAPSPSRSASPPPSSVPTPNRDPTPRFAKCIHSCILTCTPPTPHPHPPPQESVVAAARAAVRYITETSNSIYTTELVRVVSATKQVVAGAKFHLVLLAAPTTCLKANVESGAPSACAILSTKAREYEVDVLSQPWRTPAFTVNIIRAGGKGEGEASRQHG